MEVFTLVLSFGLVLTISVIGSDLFKRIHFPEILGFILVGVILNIIFTASSTDVMITDFLDIIVAITLGFIGFNLGSELDWDTIKSMSYKILVILMMEAMFTFGLVTFIVYAFTNQFHVALVFGALASATAPAGTATIFWEQDCAGALTTTTMFILALDDIVAIVLTDLAKDYVTLFYEDHALDLIALFLPVVFDVGMSLIFGLVAGFFIVFLLNREEDHAKYIDLVIGSILVLIGLAALVNISYILPTMVFGVTIASLAKKPELDVVKQQAIVEQYEITETDMEVLFDEELKSIEVEEPHAIFHEVYQIASPLIVLFFVLIGLSLDLTLLFEIGIVGLLYMIGRTVAKWAGSALGSRIVKTKPVVQKYLGMCLLSQAGVALGLAVLIADHFAQFGTEAAALGVFILNTVVATTIIFQIFGPLAIKWAIDRSGEARSCS